MILLFFLDMTLAINVMLATVLVLLVSPDLAILPVFLSVKLLLLVSLQLSICILTPILTLTVIPIAVGNAVLTVNSKHAKGTRNAKINADNQTL
jgi:hypothetical protein